MTDFSPRDTIRFSWSITTVKCLKSSKLQEEYIDFLFELCNISPLELSVPEAYFWGDSINWAMDAFAPLQEASYQNYFSMSYGQSELMTMLCCI